MPPVHTGFSESDLLGYILDSLGRAVGATVPPETAPVHQGFSEIDLLGHAADNFQIASS